MVRNHAAQHIARLVHFDIYVVVLCLVVSSAAAAAAAVTTSATVTIVTVIMAHINAVATTVYWKGLPSHLVLPFQIIARW